MSRFSNSNNNSKLDYDSDKSLPTSPTSPTSQINNENDEELDYQVGFTNGVDYEQEFSGWSLGNATNIANGGGLQPNFAGMHARQNSFNNIQGDTFFSREPSAPLNDNVSYSKPLNDNASYSKPLNDTYSYSKPLTSSATVRAPPRSRFSISSNLEATFSNPLAPPPSNNYSMPLPPPSSMSATTPPAPTFSTPLAPPTNNHHRSLSNSTFATLPTFSQPLAPPPNNRGDSQPISPLPPTGKTVNISPAANNSSSYSQPLAPPRSSMKRPDSVVSPGVSTAKVGGLTVSSDLPTVITVNNYPSPYSPTNSKQPFLDRSVSMVVQPSSTSTVSAATLNTKAYKAAVEFLTTERSYVNGLRTLSKCQLRLKHSITLKRQILASDEISKIFGNIEEIFKLNEAFLKDLETASVTGQLIQQIPGLLQHYLKDFKCYSIYSIYYESAMKYLSQLRDQREEFKKFLELEELCENTSLESFLITPVQRVPRYLLLTEILVKQMDTVYSFILYFLILVKPHV